MGARQRNRVVNDKPVIPPQPFDVADDDYKGPHPDDIDYPHLEVITDGKRSLELKAFTLKGMTQLRRIAEEQFLPVLEAEGLECAVLCQKRRDSGTGRTTLGVCWGRRAQEHGRRKAIMLRHPHAEDPRVAATLLHEVAHLDTEHGHGIPFRTKLGELTANAVGENTPFTKWRRQLIGFAKGDSYRPIPPQGTWDDYAVPTAQPSYEVGLDEEPRGFFEEAESLPPAVLTVDASFGVENWGFREELMPRRDPAAIAVEVDLRELVDDYLRRSPGILEDTGNGGFDWDTDSMGLALAELYDRKLQERGVARRRINKLRQAMDFGWGIKQNLRDIEPILDSEVRTRRAEWERIQELTAALNNPMNATPPGFPPALEEELRRRRAAAGEVN